MAGYFSPQAFANALSGASHLRSLSLHFLSFPPRRNYVGLPPPGGHRIVLPALTCFKYRGISKYLDSFVARIDAPHLRDIDITFFSQPTMDASQLGQFIERTEMQTSLTEAEIQISAHAISISFKNSSTSTPLRLQISCKQLDWQLSSMAQVCDQFSPFLFGVEHLVFNTNDFQVGRMTWMVNNGYNLFAHLAAPELYRLLANFRQASCVLCDQPTMGTRLTQLCFLRCAIFVYRSLCF